MPNETSNVLKIYGDQEDIDKFLKDHFEYGPEHKEDYQQISWKFDHSVPITNKEYLDADKELNSNNLDSNKHNNLVNIIQKYRELSWGTNCGIVSYNKNNKIHIDTPWTPCNVWFKNMIAKYPLLNFSLKYNDEYREEFYGWAVACKGELIDCEIICLHPSTEEGGINIFKYYNDENFNNKNEANYDEGESESENELSSE